MKHNSMTIIATTLYGQTIQIYKELQLLFENACDCYYYGDGMEQWIQDAMRFVSKDDAQKIRNAALTFMGNEEQPDLEPLSNIKFLK